MTCEQAASYLLRAVDDPGALDGPARAALRAHLATCDRCQQEFEDQRAIAALLRARPPDVPSAEFCAALAARLGAAGGWLAIADWRRWTLRLSPIAALLVIGALLSDGLSNPPTTGRPTGWGASEPTSPASVLWQFDMAPDAVVETLLTGRPPMVPSR